MALIDVTRRDGVLKASGDLEFIRRADPNRDSGGNLGFSLEAGWQWHSGELEVFADRLGMLPIFYRIERSRLLLGTSLVEISAAAGRPRVSGEALAVFLRVGFYLGDSTPFEEVRVLSPGTKARITADELKIPRCDGFLQPEISRLDRDAAVRRYIELFRDAVAARRSSGRVGFPLSGGRDSRHILLELVRSGVPPAFAVTYQEPGLGDATVAAELCAGLNLPHVLTSLSPGYYVETEDRKNRQTHFLTDEHYWFPEIVTVLIEQKADLFFDGIGGDVLSNGLFFDAALHAAFRSGDSRAIAERLLGPPRALPFLSPTWRDVTAWETARDFLLRELVRHMEHTNPIKSFFFWNRTRREIALAPFVLAEQIQVATPYLAPDLLDFLMSLPGDEFGPPGFHDRAMATAYPEHTNIAYATKQSNVGSRASLAECLSVARFLLRVIRSPYASRRFVLPRLLRLLGARSLATSQWWLSRLVYVEGLFS